MEGDITLYSHEECLKDKKKEAANFRHIEEESNKYAAARILQNVGKQVVVVNPPYPPLTTEELDHSFDLPYTRLPHPKYKGKRIPAYDMITLHAPAPSQVQGQAHPRLRHDQALCQHPPRMLRRMCLLHHLRPSGKVHHEP